MLNPDKHDQRAYYDFTNLKLPSDFSLLHHLIKGATGAGKSIVIGAIMRSLFLNPIIGGTLNGIVLDAKGDLYSKLLHIFSKDRLKLLRLTDMRTFAWDIAKDVTTVAEAEAVANILVPEVTGEKSPFFTDATRTLLIGVFKYLIRHHSGQWTLRDVLLILRDLNLVKELLASDPYTKHHLNVLRNNETTANLEATILTKLGKYETVASLSEHAQDKFSLKEWIDSNKILVIGLDDSVAASFDPIIVVFLERAFQLLLRQPETRQLRHALFFDEICALAKLSNLHRLMTKARSKGVSVTIGFQSIEQFRDIYTPAIADTIVDQCMTKSLHRLNSPTSAEYASKIIGEVINRETTHSRNVNREDLFDRSYGQNQQLQQRFAVIASEFLNIPVTNPQNGLRGYQRIAEKVIKLQMPWREVEQKLLLPETSAFPVKAFDPVPDDYQWLKPFTQEDYARLNINLETQQPQAASTAKEATSLDALGNQIKALNNPSH